MAANLRGVVALLHPTTNFAQEIISPSFLNEKQASILLIDGKVVGGEASQKIIEKLHSSGFKVVVATEYDEEFIAACEQQPLLAIQLQQRQLDVFVEHASKLHRYQLTVDEKRKEVYDAKGNFFRFQFHKQEGKGIA